MLTDYIGALPQFDGGVFRMLGTGLMAWHWLYRTQSPLKSAMTQISESQDYGNNLEQGRG
jgi:hypothetical protein